MDEDKFNKADDLLYQNYSQQNIMIRLEILDIIEQEYKSFCQNKQLSLRQQTGIPQINNKDEYKANDILEQYKCEYGQDQFNYLQELIWQFYLDKNERIYNEFFNVLHKNNTLKAILNKMLQVQSFLIPQQTKNNYNIQDKLQIKDSNIYQTNLNIKGQNSQNKYNSSQLIIQLSSSQDEKDHNKIVNKEQQQMNYNTHDYEQNKKKCEKFKQTMQNKNNQQQDQFNRLNINITEQNSNLIYNISDQQINLSQVENMLLNGGQNCLDMLKKHIEETENIEIKTNLMNLNNKNYQNNHQNTQKQQFADFNQNSNQFENKCYQQSSQKLVENKYLNNGQQNRNMMIKQIEENKNNIKDQIKQDQKNHLQNIQNVNINIQRQLFPDSKQNINDDISFQQNNIQQIQNLLLNGGQECMNLLTKHIEETENQNNKSNQFQLDKINYQKNQFGNINSQKQIFDDSNQNILDKRSFKQNSLQQVKNMILNGGWQCINLLAKHIEETENQKSNKIEQNQNKQQFDQYHNKNNINIQRLLFQDDQQHSNEKRSFQKTSFPQVQNIHLNSGQQYINLLQKHIEETENQINKPDKNKYNYLQNKYKNQNSDINNQKFQISDNEENLNIFQNKYCQQSGFSHVQNMVQNGKKQYINKMTKEMEERINQNNKFNLIQYNQKNNQQNQNSNSNSNLNIYGQLFQDSIQNSNILQIIIDDDSNNVSNNIREEQNSRMSQNSQPNIKRKQSMINDDQNIIFNENQINIKVRKSESSQTKSQNILKQNNNVQNRIVTKCQDFNKKCLPQIDNQEFNNEILQKQIMNMLTPRREQNEQSDFQNLIKLNQYATKKQQFQNNYNQKNTFEIQQKENYPHYKQLANNQFEGSQNKDISEVSEQQQKKIIQTIKNNFISDQNKIFGSKQVEFDNQLQQQSNQKSNKQNQEQFIDNQKNTKYHNFMEKVNTVNISTNKQRDNTKYKQLRNECFTSRESSHHSKTRQSKRVGSIVNNKGLTRNQEMQEIVIIDDDIQS